MDESRHFLQGPARDVRMLVLVGRGDVEAALHEAELLLPHARDVRGEQLPPGLADVARVFVAAGRRAEADELLTELLADHADDLGFHWLRDVPLLLAELGREDDYLAAAGEGQPTPWLKAGVAVARGELVAAADAYGRLGARATEAWARLLAAESLAAEGHEVEGRQQAARAAAYFREVRATPYLRRAEALLDSAAQAASGGGGPSASIT
jgi:hypothetical protein